MQKMERKGSEDFVVQTNKDICKSEEGVPCVPVTKSYCVALCTVTAKHSNTSIWEQRSSTLW